MKILYYFYELDTPMFRWQRDHFMDELKRYDIEIVTFNPAKFASNDEANENIIKFAESMKGGFDLFMSCDDSNVLYPQTVKEIKRKFSVPTLLICWDNLYLPYKQKALAKEFDLVWLTSSETEYMFKSWGCNTIYAPYAANPFYFQPYPKAEIINKVGFIGSPYGGRANKINFLLSNNIDCAVYSDSIVNLGYNHSLGSKKNFNPYDFLLKLSRFIRFPIGRKVLYSTILNKLNPQSKLELSSNFLTKECSVTHDEMCRLFSSFTLSINISELCDTYILRYPIHKIHLRTFEIPMCGGAQITSFTSEMSTLFVEGKEIILYRSEDELRDKARFYLNEDNQEIVKKIKIAARKRAENEHTWNNRFKAVLSCL